MAQIRYIWRLVWFLVSLVYCSSSAISAARNLTPEKFPRHDKNWWFWNQEAKEKQMPFDDIQKKGENVTHKLLHKKSIHSSTSNAAHLLFLRKEPPKYSVVEKRWLSGNFGFCGGKKPRKESRKWVIDAQRSSSLSNVSVIQDPWVIPKKIPHQEADFQTSAGSRVKSFRKNNVHLNSLQRKYNDYYPANTENIPFRSLDHSDGRVSDSVEHHSQKVTQFPEQHGKTLGFLRPLPTSVYQQAWNKSRDPVWDRYMTPYNELKFNPLRNPYPFHDSRSSIKWYTTPNYGLIRNSQTPVMHDNRLAVDEKGDEVFGGILKNKGVAKSKDKKSKGLPEQGLKEYELIPKVHALYQLKNRNKNYNDQLGWLANSVTNPIIVPGFKHKSEAPYDEQVSVHPYIVQAEERRPFNEEFIQVSRANRNQTRNIFNDHKMTASGGPFQLPSPYAFPGGVNISILVPHLQPPSSHETHPNTMTSASDEKNSKKKKERKKKVKSDDELVEGILSEPRSLTTARPNARKFPYAGETKINPINGEKNERTNEVQLINYGSKQSNALGMKHPIFELKPENISLLSHVRNFTLDRQLDTDIPLRKLQTENTRKPHYSEDDDNDEISMLYDEQASAATAQPFSWYRFTDFTSTAPHLQDFWGIGRLTSPPVLKTGNGFKGSGKVMPGMNNDEDVQHPIMSNFKGGNKLKFKRLVRGERSNIPETEAIQMKNYDFPSTQVKTQNPGNCLHGNELRDEPRDQWEVLDDDLKGEMHESAKSVVWQAKNRKRETDYYDHSMNDEQGYYRLSIGGNPMRNPTNYIMSAFRSKPGRPRERDYYDEIPEEPKPKDAVPSVHPK